MNWRDVYSAEAHLNDLRAGAEAERLVRPTPSERQGTLSRAYEWAARQLARLWPAPAELTGLHNCNVSVLRGCEA
jgi:hypothetical protein